MKRYCVRNAVLIPVSLAILLMSFNITVGANEMKDIHLTLEQVEIVSNYDPPHGYYRRSEVDFIAYDPRKRW